MPPENLPLPSASITYHSWDRQAAKSCIGYLKVQRRGFGAESWLWGRGVAWEAGGHGGLSTACELACASDRGKVLPSPLRDMAHSGTRSGCELSASVQDLSLDGSDPSLC